MYNPSRGGVRGGADQFTWESVKTDKHRENYLGHSLKAPVGRWQKGKDLSWYAKERKDDEETLQSEKTELQDIKRAEEEAMLIALGHKVVRKETQALSKEEMAEALKRNVGERNELNIDRVDGVGASSRRAVLLTGVGKDSRSDKEGVLFETRRERSTVDGNEEHSSPSHKKSKSKKKSKKHKKEKKYKRSKPVSDSDDSEAESNRRKQRRDYDSIDSLLKKQSKKKSKQDSKQSSSDNDSNRRVRSKTQDKHRAQNRDTVHSKRRRHDTSESD